MFPPGSDLKKRVRDSEGRRARAAAAASLAAAAPTTAVAEAEAEAAFPAEAEPATAPSSPTDAVPILALLGDAERPLLFSRSARIAPSSAATASAAREGEGERREQDGEFAAAEQEGEQEAKTSRCLLLREERERFALDSSWSVCTGIFLRVLKLHERAFSARG